MTANRKSERIYLTAKTRVVAESRARDLNSFLNFLMSWYSFCLIAVSISNLAGSLKQSTVSFSATIMSVAIFGVSIYLLSGRISQSADEFRKCYLSLNSIYHSSDDEATKMTAYDQILGQYPNHRQIDYDIMVSEAFSRNQKLWNDEGEIQYTDEMKCRVRQQNALRILAKTVLFFLPFLIISMSVALSAVYVESPSLTKADYQ